MTTQSERIRTIHYTRDFLMRLIDRKNKIKISELRHEAFLLLRHYPTISEFDWYFKERE